MDTPTGFDGSGVEAPRMARGMLVIGVLLTLLTASLFIAAPQPMGVLGYTPPNWAAALPWVGMLMPVVGLAWMVSIHRRAFDPEPDQDAWRYRAD